MNLPTQLKTVYRLLISPFLHTLCGPFFGCRFVPSCSEYTAEAYQQYGYIKGTGFALKRVSRCHPFAQAGYDPLPRDIGQNSKTQNSKTETSNSIREGRLHGP